MTKRIILESIKFYQTAVSPALTKRCRFYPSCSEYALLVIEKYGVFKGLCLAAKRIMRCSPLSRGGVDLP